MNSEHYHQKKVASAVEGYCESRNITEADFAELVDLTPVHLSRVKGGGSASYEVLCKIAFLTGNKINYFLKPVPKSLTDSLEQKLALTAN